MVFEVLTAAPGPRSAGSSDLCVSVNAVARLDGLPVSAVHRRILTLIGIGMSFDGYDVYVAATVPGATLKTVFPHSLRTPSLFP